MWKWAAAAAVAGVVVAVQLKRRRRLTLVKARQLSPADITMGAIWISPGGGAHGDGNRPDPGHANAVATVRAALDAGIRDFDTAPWYGSGASEERLGRALRELNSDYSGIKCITKVGRLVRTLDGMPVGAGFDEPGQPPLSARRFVNSYTSAGATMSLKESLEKLTLPCVHGLRVHDPNDNSVNKRGAPGGWVDEVAIALQPDGCFAALRRMREEGLISEVGIGMNCNNEAHQGVPDEIIRILQGVPAGTVDSALLAGGWNLLTQDGLACFAECERLGVAVHVAGVFASGLLVGGDTYAYKQAPAAKVTQAAAWRALAAEHGYSLPAVAIAFAALPKCVTRVVLGMANPEQVAQNLAWVVEAGRVQPQIWEAAKLRGLLAAEVPI